MIQYLINAAIEVRVDSMDEVEMLHKKLQEESADNGDNLSNFSWTKKEVKAQGEVVDEYYQVKYKRVFNDLKDPETILNNIDYDLRPYGGIDFV